MAVHVIIVKQLTTWTYQIDDGQDGYAYSAEAKAEAMARWEAGDRPPAEVYDVHARWLCARFTPRKD